MGLFWGMNFTSFLGNFVVANERGASVSRLSVSEHFFLQITVFCQPNLMTLFTGMWEGPN